MAAREEPEEARWLSRGVGGIGAASLLSDMGHEVPTSLLPSFLTSTLGAPAAALGVIEGVADGAAGLAKLAGDALADDPHRRRTVAVGGYVVTAVLSSAIAGAVTTWQVAVLRTGAWISRGVRGPARNALLADVAPPEAYGRAYGFERAMDNFGAILGPVLAIVLVGVLGVRGAIGISVVPGLLAAAAILYAIRHAPRAERREHAPLRLRVRPVLRGRLGRLFVAITLFEVGNASTTLLILRATDALRGGRSEDAATQLALALYVAYNVAATFASYPAGWLGDRRVPGFAFAFGVGCFALAYSGFAFATGPIALAAWFVVAGFGIAAVETAEHSAVAAFAPADVRGSAFGLLAGVQSGGNLAASAVAGVLWSLVSPTAAFVYLAVFMVLSLLAVATVAPGTRGGP